MTLALALLVLVPVALAGGSPVRTQSATVVEGHTVLADIVRQSTVSFAAVAGTAEVRTTVRGVLWFNDEELFPGVTLSREAQGNFVLATEAGDDDPRRHLQRARYVESYAFVDPNAQSWIVDRYEYDGCGVAVALVSASVGCGTEPIFVVAVGPDAFDPTLSRRYNFVNLVRLDALDAVRANGQRHPDPFNGPPTGDSHPPDVAAHNHDTAKVDLWFSRERPPEPAVRRFLFVDTA